MMISSPEIWKTHKRKGEFNVCPHCNAPLRWIYDGLDWYSCDKEPVLFMLHPQGKCTVLYKREIYTNALIYKKGDKRFNGIQPLQGNIPHYYTCSVLRERRRLYAMERNSKR